jgi:hypothetical protein
MERIGRFVRGFGRFWYDFVVGDDPKIAIGVVIVLALGALLVGPVGAGGPALVAGLAVLVLVAFTVAVLVDVSRSRGGS